MSKEEFEIPGMFIAREDIKFIIAKRENIGGSKAIELSKNLTDAQMDAIAEGFAQEFFDGNDMFQELLKDVVEELEELGVLDFGGES